MNPEAQHDPNLGRVWGGDFRVERKLGSGGMGAVYLLRNTKIPSSLLAMKVLHAGTSQAVTERFQQEARVASELASHRVVKPLTFGQFDDGAWYIVMEYVDGRSLADELAASGPLPIAAALKISLRVADTMKEAHDKGIIHRDLKPPNLMLTSEGKSHHHVKVLDFGVARASGALRVASTNNRMIVGTTGYMSPEAAIGLGVDGRTDVFSLGVVLYEMLVGALPIPLPRAPSENADEEFKAWVLELLKRRAPPPSARRPEVPAIVDEVVARALASEAAERFDMAGFQAALDGALVRLSGVVQGPLATMLSISPPADYRPASAPTLSTPAGEVARLRARLVSREPVDSACAEPIAKPARRRWSWPLLFLLMMGAAAALVVWRWAPSKAAPASRPSIAPAAPPPAPVAPNRPPAAPREERAPGKRVRKPKPRRPPAAPDGVIDPFGSAT